MYDPEKAMLTMLEMIGVSFRPLKPEDNPVGDFDGDIINTVRINRTGESRIVMSADAIEMKKAPDGSYYMPEGG